MAVSKASVKAAWLVRLKDDSKAVRRVGCWAVRRVGLLVAQLVVSMVVLWVMTTV